MFKFFLCLTIVFCFCFAGQNAAPPRVENEKEQIKTGAEQTEEY